MRKTITLLFFAIFFGTLFNSCKKEAGSGGSSTITGRIWVKDYPGPLEYGGLDEDVYLIYGDDVSYSDRVRANYDGYYEFKFLRKGDYKIYVYSADITGTINSGKEAIIKEVSITKNKQTVEVPTITINK